MIRYRTCTLVCSSHSNCFVYCFFINESSSSTRFSGRDVERHYCIIFHTIHPLKDLLGILFEGFTSNTGVEEIDELLTRGGMESMFFTIGIVLLALSLGGLLFTLGIVPKLLSAIEKSLKKVSSVIVASALTAIGINVLIGEQYLSILLTGETYQAQYKKVGLDAINLSRVSEDAGTVVNPLVPWSVCGVFITKV